MQFPTTPTYPIHRSRSLTDLKPTKGDLNRTGLHPTLLDETTFQHFYGKQCLDEDEEGGLGWRDVALTRSTSAADVRLFCPNGARFAAVPDEMEECDQEELENQSQFGDGPPFNEQGYDNDYYFYTKDVLDAHFTISSRSGIPIGSAYAKSSTLSEQQFRKFYRQFAERRERTIRPFADMLRQCRKEQTEYERGYESQMNALDSELEQVKHRISQILERSAPRHSAGHDHHSHREVCVCESESLARQMEAEQIHCTRISQQKTELAKSFTLNYRELDGRAERLNKLIKEKQLQFRRDFRAATGVSWRVYVHPSSDPKPRQERVEELSSRSYVPVRHAVAPVIADVGRADEPESLFTRLSSWFSSTATAIGEAFDAFIEYLFGWW